MAMAAMTRNLARFVLAAGALLVSLILLISIGTAVVIQTSRRTTSGTGDRPRGVGSRRGVAMLLLLLAAVLVPILIQGYVDGGLPRDFGRRRLRGPRRHAFISWPWPWQGQSFPISAAGRGESALRLIAASPKGEFRPQNRSDWNRAPDFQVGDAQLRMRGVEEGWLATARLRRQHGAARRRRDADDLGKRLLLGRSVRGGGRFPEPGRPAPGSRRWTRVGKCARPCSRRACRDRD